jgi:hypothetical protein
MSTVENALKGKTIREQKTAHHSEEVLSTVPQQRWDIYIYSHLFVFGLCFHLKKIIMLTLSNRVVVSEECKVKERFHSCHVVLTSSD